MATYKICIKPPGGIMTRTELIKLLQDSFVDYPSTPEDAVVAYAFSGNNYSKIDHLRMRIVEGKPLVILI